MKCSKCGYLGFEQADRCRNCGYEFALATRHVEPELAMRDETSLADIDDLDLVDAAAAAYRTTTSVPTADTPASGRQPAHAAATPADPVADLPLFGDDVPLITRPSPPRPPLAVRRATPEVPRLRAEPRADVPRTPTLVFQEPELEMPLEATVSPAVRAADPEWAPAAASTGAAAGLATRFAATAIDLLLLAVIDLAVVYLTIQICGLSADELHLLPIGPLVAFLVVQNGGYLVAFTAGGQTIGKMMTGIRVVAADPGESLDLARSFQRTLLWAFMVLPAGLGLLSALFSPDRRGLHDRFAGTRVVRAHS